MRLCQYDLCIFSAVFLSSVVVQVVSDKKSVNPNKNSSTKKILCLCGEFPTSIPESYAQPILSQSPDLIIKCDNEGEETCLKICMSLAKAVKAHNIDLICSRLGTANELVLSAFYSICDGQWTYIESGIEKRPVCCEGGKVKQCPSAFNTGRCLCGAFLTRKPEADEPPLVLKDIDYIVECNEEADIACRSNCLAYTEASKNDIAIKLCAHLDTVTELKISGFYKVCENPWAYQNMTGSLCCLGGKSVMCDSDIESAPCTVGAFLTKGPGANDKPLVHQEIDFDFKIKCDAAGETACKASSKEMVLLQREKVASRLCATVKDVNEVKLYIFYKICNRQWSYTNMQEALCCVESRVVLCSSKAKTGPCLCGAFLTQTPTATDKPFKMFDYLAPVTCNEEGEQNCLDTCAAVAQKKRKEIGEQLCSELKSADNVKVSALYKNCEDSWIYIEGITGNYCCKDGTVVICGIGNRDVVGMIGGAVGDIIEKWTAPSGNCSCSTFVERAPKASDSPLYVKTIDNAIICDKEGENICKESCAELPTDSDQVCTKMKIADKVTLSAFYKLCENPWTYYSDMPEPICCANSIATECASLSEKVFTNIRHLFETLTTSSGKCLCGVFQTQAPEASDEPVLFQEVNPSVKCNEEGKKLCKRSCLDQATDKQSSAVDQACNVLKNGIKFKITAFYMLCENPWTYVRNMIEICCQDSKVEVCPHHQESFLPFKDGSRVGR